MNEEIIKEMKKFFINIPKPHNSIYKELLLEIEKRIIKDLQTRPVEEILAWLKTQIVFNPKLQGITWLSNSCKQTYAKLWKLSKK
jgi:hypothetical protein